MPRQRGGSAPPRRPTAAPARPAPAPATQRHSSTAAAPQQRAPPAPAPMQQQATGPTPQGPGLFGQMASTAAGVAVGSSIGHAVGGWFGGGSSSAPAEASPQSTDFAQQHQQTADMTQGGACATDVGNFRRCMDENQGSLTICGWYLDQLKACQAAAGQY